VQAIHYVDKDKKNKEFFRKVALMPYTIQAIFLASDRNQFIVHISLVIPHE